ncbi:MAG TPA: RIP metalloprotease RseP [Janthinobacterium sp.]|jgi:regulator of sigma E protease|nr:RIP metalloprotease RseP [Janthinobacterium sp.]
MTLLQTLLAFVVALGSLVIFHELGHYSVARLCGVKVLRFSVGMGRVVWSRRFGPDQTEWALSMLPLGGYVKMLDARDPDTDAAALSPQDLRREFTRQSVWRRIAIVGAGPLANFLLAIALFAGLYMHGIEEPASKLAAPPPASAALAAGLQRGDVVESVNGRPAPSWSGLRWEMMRAALDGRGAELALLRPGQGHVSVALPASALRGSDLDGDVLGKLGIELAFPPAQLGEIAPGGAGARAGLRADDVIRAIDGKPVADGPALIAIIRGAAGKTLEFEGSRAGAPLRLAVRPDAAIEGAVTVGKISAVVTMAPDMIAVASSPSEAVAKAARKVWETSTMTLKVMGRMIAGQASLKNVTGPITIADYAGQTARIGAISYLSFIAMVSISLGVMNLLPVPVLDGGLLLYYSLEVLTGRPVPKRVDEIAQRVGVGLLVALMALAVFNDIGRLLT